MTAEELVESLEKESWAWGIGLASTSYCVHRRLGDILLLKEAVRQGIHWSPLILEAATKLYDSPAEPGFAHNRQEEMCVYLWLLSKRTHGVYADIRTVDAHLFLKRIVAENAIEWGPYVPSYARFLLNLKETEDA